MFRAALFLILLVFCLGLLRSQGVIGSGSMAADPGDDPGAHFRIPNPAELDPDRAEAIYRSIRSRMAGDYAESADPLARTYQRWHRLNRFPYPSAGHGRIFVNNYANAVSADQFAARARSDSYPVGSVIVKDGFIVTEAGDILTGPLNIIERHPPGEDPSNPQGWRYIQIRPDGTVIGAGARDERTRFCAACHVRHNGAIAPFFFVPQGKESGKP